MHEQRLDWWQWQDGVYEPLAADAQGIVRSAVFPGLWLHIPALLDGNLIEVVATLQMGLASPEHEAFVARLQAGNPRDNPPLHADATPVARAKALRLLYSLSSRE